MTSTPPRRISRGDKRMVKGIIGLVVLVLAGGAFMVGPITGDLAVSVSTGLGAIAMAVVYHGIPN